MVLLLKSERKVEKPVETMEKFYVPAAGQTAHISYIR